MDRLASNGKAYPPERQVRLVRVCEILDTDNVFRVTSGGNHEGCEDKVVDQGVGRNASRTYRTQPSSSWKPLPRMAKLAGAFAQSSTCIWSVGNRRVLIRSGSPLRS